MDVKKALKAHGHNISSMAKLMGISQQALSQQINNNSITFAKIEMIAELCGVGAIDFIQSGCTQKQSVFCAFVYDGKMHTFDDKDKLISYLNDEE